MRARERSIAARRANLTRSAAALLVPRLLPAIKEVVSVHVAQLDARELARAAKLASRKRVDALLELLDIRVASMDHVFVALCAVLEPVVPSSAEPAMVRAERQAEELIAAPPAYDGRPRDSRAVAAARRAKEAGRGGRNEWGEYEDGREVGHG